MGILRNYLFSIKSWLLKCTFLKSTIEMWRTRVTDIPWWEKLFRSDHPDYINLLKKILDTPLMTLYVTLAAEVTLAADLSKTRWSPVYVFANALQVRSRIEAKGPDLKFTSPNVINNLFSYFLFFYFPPTFLFSLYLRFRHSLFFCWFFLLHTQSIHSTYCGMQFFKIFFH